MAIRELFGWDGFVEMPDFCPVVGMGEDVVEGVELVGAIGDGFGVGAFGPEAVAACEG